MAALLAGEEIAAAVYAGDDRTDLDAFRGLLTGTAYPGKVGARFRAAFARAVSGEPLNTFDLMLCAWKDSSTAGATYTSERASRRST